MLIATIILLGGSPLRPPATPLITSDPYLSIWSESDNLNGDVTRHWTHRAHDIESVITVDGHDYLLMGNRRGVDTLPQTSLRVTPTRSLYKFANSQIQVALTFMTPALPNELAVLARPVTYMTWDVKSADEKSHQVTIKNSFQGTIAVSQPAEPVAVKGVVANGLRIWRVGTEGQPILGSKGDDARIDWGYLYVAGAEPMMAPGTTEASGPAGDCRIDANFYPVRVTSAGTSRHLMVGYDEIDSINYFGRRLQPYWRRNGDGPTELLTKAAHDYPRLVQKCETFDNNLTTDLSRVGGEKYAQIASLAYRQALAACGLAADSSGQPLLFTKENTSNGDIATVDVIYPMDPMLICLSPALAKASLVSDLDYAASSRWRFPNAPHDLGTYPIASGRDDGGEGMPVEESGNMILLCDAIAQAEGKPDFVAPWWPQLTQWEQYLEKYGYDPEDQLCTDDFMGHLAHNSNLAVKAILAIAAYGDLARMRGDLAAADRTQRLARGYAKHWMDVAMAGDHSLLAFDRPNTWSQKYNLVWDHILDLNVFPASLAEKEVAYYIKQLQPYGVPLDSRTKLTKLDWSVWSASLADDKAQFQQLIDPIWTYLDTTTNRQPMVDSYVTNKIGSNGMHARPVVGGVFIRMLDDRSIWRKWARQGDQKVGPWAPLPKPPTVVDVIPSSQSSPQTWRYSLFAPPPEWTHADFDESSWRAAPGPFGSDGTPGIQPRTQWTTDDIWLRREITVPAATFKDLQLIVYHDEDVQVYVNGILACSESGYENSYEPVAMTPAARACFKPGAHLTLAVHCHQTTGGQGVDIGVVDVR